MPKLSGGIRSCGHADKGGKASVCITSGLHANPRGDAAVDSADAAAGHTITSYNSSGLRSLKRYLLSTGSLVVAAQETGITESLYAEVVDWCAGRGWKVLHSPAKASDCEGSRGATSAGVAVFVRHALGLRWPEPGMGEGRGVVYPHRSVHVIVELVGWPPFGVTSSYLFAGEGLSRSNLKVMAAMGTARGPKSPDLHVWAADWNMNPSVVD